MKQFGGISFLERFIIDTVVYFDLFSYPLTAYEIYSYLYVNGMTGASFSFEEVHEALNTSEALTRSIQEKNGFYFLKGNAEHINVRHERYLLSHEKYKKALGAARVMSLFPWIRMAAVCNSLAQHNVTKESDIDFFIITRSQRIWLTRFLLTLILPLFGYRRHGKAKSDPVCLSFFVTDDMLEFRSLMLPGKDIYFPYWVSQLVPVYDDGVYSEFLSHNEWVREYIPHVSSRIPSYQRRVSRSWLCRIISSVITVLTFGPLGTCAEWAARGIQKAKLSPEKKTRAADKDTCVIISDTMLKFHENDRREEFALAHDALTEKIAQTI